MTRVLLRYDDARIDSTGRSGPDLLRAEECALLKTLERPVVLSDRNTEVQARYSCARPMCRAIDVDRP